MLFFNLLLILAIIILSYINFPFLELVYIDIFLRYVFMILSVILALIFVFLEIFILALDLPTNIGVIFDLDLVELFLDCVYTFFSTMWSIVVTSSESYIYVKSEPVDLVVVLRVYTYCSWHYYFHNQELLNSILNGPTLNCHFYNQELLNLMLKAGVVPIPKFFF